METGDRRCSAGSTEGVGGAELSGARFLLSWYAINFTVCRVKTSPSICDRSITALSIDSIFGESSQSTRIFPYERITVHPSGLLAQRLTGV